MRTRCRSSNSVSGINKEPRRISSVIITGVVDEAAVAAAELDGGDDGATTALAAKGFLNVTSHSWETGPTLPEPVRTSPDRVIVGVGRGTGGGGGTVAPGPVTGLAGVKGDVDPCTSSLATAAAALADSICVASALPRWRRAKKLIIRPPLPTSWLLVAPALTSLNDSGLLLPPPPAAGEGVAALPRKGVNKPSPPPPPLAADAAACALALSAEEKDDAS